MFGSMYKRIAAAAQGVGSAIGNVAGAARGGSGPAQGATPNHQPRGNNSMIHLVGDRRGSSSGDRRGGGSIGGGGTRGIDSGGASTTQIGDFGNGDFQVQPAVYRPPAQQDSGPDLVWA